jgi:hypothetical protein
MKSIIGKYVAEGIAHTTHGAEPFLHKKTTRFLDGVTQLGKVHSILQILINLPIGYAIMLQLQLISRHL